MGPARALLAALILVLAVLAARAAPHAQARQQRQQARHAMQHGGAAAAFARAEGVRMQVDAAGAAATLRFVDEEGREHVYEGLRPDTAGMAATEVFRGPGLARAALPHATATFSRSLPDGWVVATQLGPSAVHVVRAIDGRREYLFLQPFGMAEDHLEEAHRRDLGAMAWDDHVVTRRSMASEANHGCAAIRLDAEGLAAIEQMNRDPEAHLPLSTHAYSMENAAAAAAPAAAASGGSSGSSGSSTSTTTTSIRGAAADADADATGPRSLAHTQELYADPPKFWSDCYPGEEDIQYLKIGIVADAGFVLAFNRSEELTLRAIEAIVASTNMIYHHQVHIQVQVAQILLVTDNLPKDSSNSSYLSYLEASPNAELGVTCAYETNCKCSLTDNGSGSCAVGDLLCGILQPLEALTSFSFALEDSDNPSTSPTAGAGPSTLHFDESALTSSGLSSQAHWHLLTTCYTAPGVVGVAWGLTPSDYRPRRGTICNSLGLNVAVTSAHSTTWQTFAHELGHNLGMTHSFEEGQGLTGGLMDYDLPEYNGRIQFNERYRREELCGELTLMKDLDVCPDYFGPSSDVCEETVPYAPERLGGNMSRGYYCAGGFCPTLADGSAGSCRPTPAALVFGDEPLNYTGSRIGTQLSGYGNPVPMIWRELNESACELDLVGDFNETDIVLVERGNCTFDIKARVLAAAGAGGAVVYGEDAVEMYGDAIDVKIMMAYILSDDAERIRAAVRASDEGVLGYMGAAPPQVLSLLRQSKAPQNLAPVSQSTSPPSSGPNLILVALGSFGGVIALSLVVMIVFWARRNVRHPKRWKNANADFVQAYRDAQVGSLYMDQTIQEVHSSNVRTEGSRLPPAVEL